jgi:SAM-dependent methyltransferase
MRTDAETLERTDVFASDDLFQNKLHLQRYQFTLDQINAGEHCLEVGAGLGVLSQMLCAHGVRYAGIEINPEACQQAQRRVRSRDLIKQADAHHLPYAAKSFDVVVCLEVLEHLHDYRRALREIHRVLKPSGKLIASIPHRFKGGPGETNPFYGRNRYHLYEPGEREFRLALKTHFETVQLRYQVFEESFILNMVRRLRLRRLFRMVEPYRKLTSGHPEALRLVRIERKRTGLPLALLAVAENTTA